MLTFDNDPRFVGGACGRAFPSALVRFLLCLGVMPHVIAPHRPDVNASVERFHRTLGEGACVCTCRGSGSKSARSPRRFCSTTIRNGPTRLVPVATGLCWLHRTSVQEIGMLRIMEQASLPQHVRCEYNERGPFCSYSSSNASIFTKERVNLCCVCSPQSSNVSVSAFSRSQNGFRVGSNHRRPPLCSARSPILPEANPSCLRKTSCYDKLIILRRQIKRPIYLKTDRFLLVVLARMVRSWKKALPCPGRRRFFAGIVSSSACSGSINHRFMRECRGSRLRQSP